jgi:HPt (histidine-containing phosphotransfer) domain-containing protein
LLNSLDPLNLDYLRSVYGPAPGELQDVLREAVHASETLLDRLQIFCERGNAEAANAAHELKGMSKTIGAEELGALAEQAEELAQLGSWMELAELMEELRTAFERFAEAAKNLRE